MSVGELAPIDPEGFRSWLRERLGSGGVEFARPPERLGHGGEAVVDAFELEGLPSPHSRWRGPLVVRRLLPPADASQLRKEASVHGALVGLGYPAPRVLHVETDASRLGAPFLISERVPGKEMLADVLVPAQLARRPDRFPALIREALFEVPRLLAESQAALHALEPGALAKRFEADGFPPGEIRFDAWLDRIGSTLEGARLDGLRAGHRWLRANRPEAAPETICHGDFIFTNLCVEAGRVSGVFDWSTVGLADPAWDVAATLARLRSRLPGLPAWVDWISRRVQAGMVRRYLESYRAHARWPLAEDRLRYYEACWLLKEMTRSGERLRAGVRPGEGVELRWLHPETLAQGVFDFRQLTGITLEPLLPAEADSA